MSDELLPYYNRELEYFRRVAGEFAQAHPKIAARLRMSKEVIEDPHVSRMIEAFAFLNARTRRKIEDDFPEISHAMLQVLYPHYLAPFPSAAIVRFALSEDQPELTQGFTVRKGATLETEPIDGEPCRFRTCYPVTVWPFRVSDASFGEYLTSVPVTPWKDHARAILKLDLTAFSVKAPLGACQLESLRFFLNAPAQVVYQLYEIIFNNSLGVVVAGQTDGGPSLTLPRDSIRQVGFERTEGLVDSPARSSFAYQLLTEYFLFPEKFLFFDVAGLASEWPRFAEESTVSVFILLDRHVSELQRYVTADTFQLGCSPIINLFRQHAEPIRLTHEETEYRVVPDARRPLSHEIYSIDQVTALSGDNQHLEFSPFYSLGHHRPTSEHGGRFWHASRRRADVSGATDDGTEVFLSLVDLGFDPRVAHNWTIDVATTCLNRDLPRRLPFGGGQPHLALAEGGPLQAVACLTAPTSTFRPTYGYGAFWRLISHLSLNHLSLITADGSAEPLQEILKLYDLSDSEDTRNLIRGLLAVRGCRTVGRPGGTVAGGVCRGLEVTLHFDEDRYSGNGVYLFGAVLERFFGMYSALNSFSRTIITSNRREQRVCEWPPRAGEMVFL